MTFEELLKTYVDKKPEVLARGERYLKYFYIGVRVSNPIDELVESFRIEFDVVDDADVLCENIVNCLEDVIGKLQEIEENSIGYDGAYLYNFNYELIVEERKALLTIIKELRDFVSDVKIFLGIEN